MTEKENVFSDAEIKDDEFNKLLIRNYSTRPNQKNAYGPGLNATQTKDIFDAAAIHIKEKHNKLIEGVEHVGAAEAERKATFEQNEAKRKTDFEIAESERENLFNQSQSERDSEWNEELANRQKVFDDFFNSLDIITEPEETDPKVMSEEATKKYVKKYSEEYIPKVATRNLANLTFENAYINNGEFGVLTSGLEYAASPDYIEVTSGETYTLSWVAKTTNASVYVNEYKADKTFIKKTSGSLRVNTFTLTLDSECLYIRIHFYSWDNLPWEDIVPNNFQMELGTVATDYIAPMAIDNTIIDVVPVVNAEVQKKLVQSLGDATDKAVSQKVVTEELSKKFTTENFTVFTSNEDNYMNTMWRKILTIPHNKTDATVTETIVGMYRKDFTLSTGGAFDNWRGYRIEPKVGFLYFKAQSGNQAIPCIFYKGDEAFCPTGVPSTIGTHEYVVYVDETITSIIIVGRPSAEPNEKCYWINDFDFGSLTAESDYLYGKTLVTVGDSITYGADMDEAGIAENGELMTYGWQIANRHNMTFYNEGVSGSTVIAHETRHGFSNPNGRYTQLPSHIDYLLLWFGWNDNAVILDGEGTLGDIDSTDITSYYGAYNTVLPYLINKYPNARIGLIVPFGHSADIRQAVRDLGNKWGIGVFDNYGKGTPLYFGKEDSVGVDTNIVTQRRASWQANGAHPNYEGHKQLSTQIEAWLRTL